jgi:hypothetical protein
MRSDFMREGHEFFMASTPTRCQREPRASIPDNLPIDVNAPYLANRHVMLSCVANNMDPVFDHDCVPKYVGLDPVYGTLREIVSSFS